MSSCGRCSTGYCWVLVQEHTVEELPPGAALRQRTDRIGCLLKCRRRRRASSHREDAGSDAKLVADAAPGEARAQRGDSPGWCRRS
jgi:hypothetical protein